MKTLALVYLPVRSFSDDVISISGIDYGNNIHVSDLPDLNPQFFLGKDINGEDILCTVKDTTAPLTAVFADAQGNYTTKAEIAPATVGAELVGGRPSKRKPRA